MEIDRSRYETVTTIEQLQSWIEKINQAKLVAVDTETDNLDSMSANLVGISFGLFNGEACYIPLTHKEQVTLEPQQSDLFAEPAEAETTTSFELAKNQLNLTACLTELKPLLESADVKKIGQNIKYDLTIFANHGVQVAGVAFDTMLESYTLNSTGRHNMDELADRYLGHKTIEFEEIAGKGKNQLTFDKIAIDVASKYAAEDADVTMKLHQMLTPELEKEPTLVKLFHEIEMPLVEVLSRIERNGVLIDPEKLLAQSAEIEQRLAELEQLVHSEAGEIFNLASTKQLQEILFTKLGLPVLKKHRKVHLLPMKKCWMN